MFEKTEYVWILQKTKLNCQFRSVLRSPVFPENGKNYKWKVQLLTKSSRGNKNIELRLHLEDDTKNDVFVKYSFLVKHSEDGTTHIIGAEGEHVFQKRAKWSPLSCMDLEKIFPFTSNYDTVKIVIDVNAEVSSPQSRAMESLQDKMSQSCKLSRELDMMLSSGELSDFSIKFDDASDIEVHRIVLAARSPVFNAMFKYDTSEKKLGYMKVTDIERGTMFSLLKFIYTGVTTTLTKDEAKELLSAADKYQIVDLKEFCVDVLAENLEASDISDSLILAELHSCSRLKKVAFSYIVGNPSQFCDFSKFEELKQFPNLLMELITTLNIELSSILEMF